MCKVAGVVLRGDARRRVHVQAVLGSGLGVGGSAHVRKANARLGGAHAALQWTRHGEIATRAAAERRRAVFQVLGWPTGYGT